MKRLALLVITGCLAVVLSACGEQEKKAESGAATSVQQGNTGTDTSGAAGGAPSDGAKTGQ